MAERRMFARSITNSAKFLQMPISSRLLYYDLGMSADDDGVVEAFSVMRLTGATEDDLKVLVTKGFISILNADLVAFIIDWSRNNLIKKDRYRPSVYHDLLAQFQNGSGLEPKWNRNGTILEPQDSIGKYSIDKESIEKENLHPLSDESGTPARAKKQRYGEYSHVLLTDGEFKKLHDEFSNADEAIAFLDEYIEYKGYSAKNHYLAMKKWVFKALSERKAEKNDASSGSFNTDDFFMASLERSYGNIAE